MIIVLMFLVLCVLLESLVIKELLEQKRQIALQLKLLQEAYTWRMNSREEVITMEGNIAIYKKIYGKNSSNTFDMLLFYHGNTRTSKCSNYRAGNNGKFVRAK